jgi:hypothetical protein
MHECNGVAKFRPPPPVTPALCLSSQSAPFNMRSTRRKCGAVEGQMRQLIGYLVAGRRTERAAARMAVGIHHRFPCEPFRRKEYPTHSADCTFPGVAVDCARFPTESRSTDSAKSGTPITNIYVAERFSRHAIEKIASAIPRFGVFD